MKHFLEPVLSTQGPWGLRIERSGQWLASAAELAGTSQARRLGLRGRDGMDDDAALVIAPTQGVHTFGMKFPLDIVGVRKNGEVVTVQCSVRRRRIVLSLRAFAMVELPGGACDRTGIRVGDRLLAESRPAAVPKFTSSAHELSVE
jgi:uncharacterized protein